MGELRERLEQFLDADGWPRQAGGAPTVLRMGFSGQNGNWTCYLDVNEERRMAVFYSRCPLTIPEDRLVEVGTFLHRANYGLRLGGFEFDLDDGDIRYKTTLASDPAGWDRQTLASFFHTNVVMMDMYLPGIAAVAFGGATPEEAIRAIEGPHALDIDFELADDELNDLDDDAWLPESIRRRNSFLN